MTYRNLLYLGLAFGILQTAGTLATAWLMYRGHFGIFGEAGRRRSVAYSAWIAVAFWVAFLAGVVGVVTGHANDALLSRPS